MSITSRGKFWEISNSIWILWTFTLGFLNWIAFFYIGMRSGVTKWIYSGVFYSIPCMLSLYYFEAKTDPYRDVGLTGSVFLVFAIGIVSIVHAFRVRDEYLLRMDEILSQRDGYVNYSNQSYDTKSSPYISATYESSITEPYYDKDSIDTTGGYKSLETVSAETKLEKTPSITVDVNNDSEEILAVLLGIILAKKAVQIRKAKGGFQSKEDFYNSLGLKSHIIKQIDSSIYVGGSSSYSERLHKL